jgi:integrase/recombinase XerD
MRFSTENKVMIDGLSHLPSVRLRHINAPLLKEREQFLKYLSVGGRCRVSMRMTAAYLLHIVRIMELTELRNFTLEEIEAAGQVWASYVGPDRRCQMQGSTEYFVRAAKQWFTFNGSIAPTPLRPFAAEIEHYTDALRSIHGLAAATIEGYSRITAAFLRWLAPRHCTLGTVRLPDVLEYLAEKRASGLVNSTIAAQCQAFRSFFAHAEIMGWCVPGLPAGIRSPRITQYRGPARGPAWKDVRRLVRTTGDAGTKGLRTRAILLLLAVYGLRRSEVARLQLSDFDWRSETFLVRRAKNRGLQHYPIQYEVGEAIIDYLKHGRPKCACRHLFVSLVPPYLPFGLQGLWRAVSEKMKSIGVESVTFGPHALRHACATRLLHQGSSLQEIAEFLGHRDLNSVSIYARYDTRSLRKVAAFSLAGVQ